MDAGAVMESAADAARGAGVDPGTLISRLAAAPALAERLRDPRVRAALVRATRERPLPAACPFPSASPLLHAFRMLCFRLPAPNSPPPLHEQPHHRRPTTAINQTDVVTNGPTALQKYSGDRAVVEAWLEASEILQQQQQQQQQREAGGSQQEGGQQTAAGASCCGGGGGGGGGGSGGGGGAPAPPELEPEVAAYAAATVGLPAAALAPHLAARPRLVELLTADAGVRAAAADAAAGAPGWRRARHLLSASVREALRELLELRAALQAAGERVK